MTHRFCGVCLQLGVGAAETRTRGGPFSSQELKPLVLMLEASQCVPGSFSANMR